ncbi:MAG: toll/interleukin-1 receptor domain-containing protein [Taibaiella sp.]|nr:toll/interleukin-1 receptor domain-containing protein [Taibaiella sp.]
MNIDEITIREEAQRFVKNQLRIRIDGGAMFNSVKEKLTDFYTNEFKALFLDEIEKQIKLEYEAVAERKNDPNSRIPPQLFSAYNSFFFYLRQEKSVLPVIAHQNHVSNPNEIRNKVFVSYCHKDRDYLNEMKRHFKPFDSLIDFWDDTRIQPGKKWKEEIRKAISNTKVAILLVSADFLASEFIINNELPPLLKAAEENGAVILILILKPCLFKEVTTLSEFQAMHNISHPVIKMSETEREELYTNVVRQTLKCLKDE